MQFSLTLHMFQLIVRIHVTAGNSNYDSPNELITADC